MTARFSKITVFQYSSEAQIIKGRLEVEGIEVFLQDEFTIDTDPLVSQAIGGVKLMVYSEDEQKAMNILSAIPEHSLDRAGNAIHCPYCDSEKINYFTHINGFKSLTAFLFSFFANALPIYTSYKYSCENCHKKFNLK